ncbi:acyl-CoA carboxylase epsilon subunit [Nonomuraea wenchangensis]|uniref:acyl-CoA carboxylase epsilon subunit n=1 Tax=Nonomuraea wenchangensis TaxID=568860 RepID=UPI00341D5CDE
MNEIRVIAGAPTAEEICALICAIRLHAAATAAATAAAAPPRPARRTAPWTQAGDLPRPPSAGRMSPDR